ncbi:MAG: hypothetical protein II086_08635 [Ruminococcus sp.]|nr:hypothetical protein [Ruminococcus sp.]
MQNINNPIYNIFNMDYAQQQAIQYHNQQIYNVSDAAKKFKDFLDSSEKVNPEYQNALMIECCAILEQKRRENRRF